MKVWRRRRDESGSKAEKTSSETTPPDEAADEMRAALGEGDVRRAVELLRVELAAQERMPAIDVLAGIGVVAGAQELADAAGQAAESPEDADLLFSLAYELFDFGVPDIAVPVLREALRYQPESPAILAELVACLDECGRNRESLALLRENRHLIVDHFVLNYLLAFESVVGGDLETAREVYPKLALPPDERTTVMSERIGRMLSRALAAEAMTPLDDTDLRGWHFVITGGLLVARSSAGLDEGMNGRWAWAQDSYEIISAGLHRAHAVLEAWNAPVQRVIPLPDRASRALAHAAAEMFDLEMGELGDPLPGLVVAYDLRDAAAETLDMLSTHAPGRPIYVHAAQWTTPPQVTPDMVTMLYQSLVPPWGETMRMTDYEGGESKVEILPPDDGDAEVLARHVVDADPTRSSLDETDTTADLLAFARAVRDVAAGTLDVGGRELFWAASPVGSSRFT